MNADLIEFFDRTEVRNAIGEFEKALFADRVPRIEDYSLFVMGAERALLIEELIHIEVEYYSRRGGHIGVDDYLRRFPDLLQQEGFRERLQKTVEEFAGSQQQQTDRTSTANHGPQRSEFLAGEQLLFGIIALQNSVITREQFLAAFDSWIHDKSRRLSEVLEQHRAISVADRELLERLVEIFLQKHGGDIEKSLAAISSIPDVKSDLERLGDQEIQASLGHVSRSYQEGDPQAETLILNCESYGRFRVLRPHAKGGLGQVSVALDQEIRREVALKEILPQHQDPINRERFVLEAEITGALEHPGIVPVYSLGQTPDGRPYYAMRFVKGDSLKKAIEQYHDPENPNRSDSGSRQLALRQLLARFIDVCNAIEYAHSRGVLHRDLKPGNIMIGKYGETLVVDWGLAKVVGRKEVVSDEVTLRPRSSLSSSGQTQPGSAIGTPAYMSPEQAAGRLNDLGPTTDVYSLGATLYHILTGRPPCNGSTTEVLLRVKNGEFPSIRRVSPETPKALEAICLKAMMLDPKDRYKSPRLVADDVEHWLADEPVSVVADSFGDRLLRMGRKHRGVTRTILAGMVLFAVGSVLAAVVINYEREIVQRAHEAVDRESGARTNAERAKESALVAKANAEEEKDQAQGLIRGVSRSDFQAAQVRIEESNFDDGIAYLERSLRYDPTNRNAIDALWQLLNDREFRHAPIARCRLSHENRLRSASFSPDGRQILTVSHDTVRIWDAETGQATNSPFRHRNQVNSADFTADGRRVVTASADNTAQVWDAETGQAIGRPLQHDDDVWNARFSSDGRRVLTVSNNTARIWDAANGRVIGSPFRHSKRVNSANFGVGDRLVVTASSDKTARIWDAETGQAICRPLQHEGEVWNARCNPDGRRVVTVSLKDRTLRIWNAETNRAIDSPIQQEGYGRSFGFSPDNRRAITVIGEKTAQIWNVETAEAIGPPLQHHDGVRIANFSPDGQRVITVSIDGTARIWDAETGHLICSRFQHHKLAIGATFSPDGQRILTQGLGTARILDTVTGQEIGSTIRDSEATFSPDGKRVLTWSDKTAQVWDAVTVQAIRSPLPYNDQAFKVSSSVDGRRLCEGISAVATGKSFNLGGTLEPVPDGERRALAISLAEALADCPDWRFVVQSCLPQGPDFPIGPRTKITRRQVATRRIREMHPDDVREVLMFDPAHPLVQIALAAFETNMIIADFLREYGVRRLPDDSEFCREATRMLIRQGDLERALRALEKAEKLDASHSELGNLRTQLEDAPVDALVPANGLGRWYSNERHTYQ